MAFSRETTAAARSSRISWHLASSRKALAAAREVLGGGGGEEGLLGVVGVESARDDEVVAGLVGLVVGVVELGHEEVELGVVERAARARAADGVGEELEGPLLPGGGESVLARLVVELADGVDEGGPDGAERLALAVEVLLEDGGGPLPSVERGVAVGDAAEQVAPPGVARDGVAVLGGGLGHLLSLDVEAREADVVGGVGAAREDPLAPGDGLRQVAELLVELGEVSPQGRGPAGGGGGDAPELAEHVVAAAGGPVGHGEHLAAGGVVGLGDGGLDVADGGIALGVVELGEGPGDGDRRGHVAGGAERDLAERGEGLGVAPLLELEGGELAVVVAAAVAAVEQEAVPLDGLRAVALLLVDPDDVADEALVPGGAACGLGGGLEGLEGLGPPRGGGVDEGHGLVGRAVVGVERQRALEEPRGLVGLAHAVVAVADLEQQRRRLAVERQGLLEAGERLGMLAPGLQGEGLAEEHPASGPRGKLGRLGVGALDARGGEQPVEQARVAHLELAEALVHGHFAGERARRRAQGEHPATEGGGTHAAAPTG